MEEIYKEYFSIIYKYLCSLSHNESIAEELTQETFYRAVKNIKKYKGTCKMSTWLCQIAKNLWYTELKKEKRNLDIDIEEMYESPDILEEYINKEQKMELYKKIAKLDDKTKEVIYLRLNGVTFKEIGEILGKNENWAKIIFYRGKEKLKESEKDE
mgnify:FL=1